MHKGPKALKSSRADLVLSSSHYQNSFHTLKTHKLVSNTCIEASTTTKCIFEHMHRGLHYNKMYFWWQNVLSPKVLYFVAYDFWRQNIFFGDEIGFVAYIASPKVLVTKNFITKSSEHIYIFFDFWRQNHFIAKCFPR